MELTIGQITIIGLVASVLSQGLKLLFAWLKKDINDKTVMIFVYVISVVLAFTFIMPEIPTVEWDAVTLTNFLVNQMAAVFGMATVVYAFLLKVVYEKLNLTKSRFLGNG